MLVRFLGMLKIEMFLVIIHWWSLKLHKGTILVIWHSRYGKRLGTIDEFLIIPDRMIEFWIFLNFRVNVVVEICCSELFLFRNYIHSIVWLVKTSLEIHLWYISANGKWIWLNLLIFLFTKSWLLKWLKEFKMKVLNFLKAFKIRDEPIN